jgi:F420-dependent oxidoreductase-like protein
MRIGIFAGVTGSTSFDDLLSDVRAAGDAGFDTYWMPQIFSWDAMTMISLVAQQVPGIRFGTAVVPTYPRHPWVMAQQALTTAALSGGRFSLGIGLSHQVVIEGMWGMSFAKPLAHLRGYLDVLMPLVENRAVSVSGEQYTARGQLDLPATACPVLVAALGPRMLELAGARTDGTITWMTGPRTLANHTVPALTAAALAANRGAPRVVAGMPICVTDDVDAARAHAAKAYAVYGQLPSYRAMLDRESLAGPEDLAIIGDEATVKDRLAELTAAGATDLAASEFGVTAEDRRRTRVFLAQLL